MKPKSTLHSISILLLLGTGCQEIPLPFEDDGGTGEVTRAANAPPILGGTLLVTRDGKYAVIADPPRDLVHIVDLVEWKETGTIELAEGALPFRGIEDAEGKVHITARGSGAVVTVNPDTAELTRSTTVCPNPRGIAYDGGAEALHVACAGGLFVTLPDDGGAPTQRFVAPDLRDVFVSGGRVYVTRFRSADVLEIEPDGGWSRAGAPVSLVRNAQSRQPTTAWRTLPRPEGGWLMLHQAASTDPVPEFEEPSDEPTEPDPGGYGGGSSGDPCGVVVNPTLSATEQDGVVRHMGLLGSVALAVDVAISPSGGKVAIAIPSQQGRPEDFQRASVVEIDVRELSDRAEAWCQEPFGDAQDPHDDIVAVAYTPEGAVLAQARDQPVLYRITGGEKETLTLHGSDATDTGFALFHNDAGEGISCASCHPEGGEDGRTWVFEDNGPRRTQALNVGLEGTAPFHWAGDMDDIHMIARKVRQRAMGGSALSDDQQDALRDWIFSLRPPNPPRSQSSASAEDGQQLFGSLGCVSCHAGASFTSPASSDLGAGPLQTPALRGVALRPPYMHDGRSGTLEDAVLDMVTKTAGHVELDDGQVASLVAYLETL